MAAALVYAVVALVMHQNGFMKDRAEPLIVRYVMSTFAIMALIQFPIMTGRIVKENRRKIAVGIPLTGSIPAQSMSDTALLLASYRPPDDCGRGHC